MSTEQKPPEAAPQPQHKEHLETNALGDALLTGWQKFKAGQLVSYKWMGIGLIAIAAFFLLWYILSERASERSKLWVELENANSRTGLIEFAEKNPNTMAANVAQLDLARYLVGPEGIDKLPTARDENERKIAIENIEKSRELFTKLLDAFKDQPIMKVQCLVGMAKSEAAFVGLTKPGTLDSLGSTDKLAEWLDKIAEAADGTPWGDDAKKMSASLKSGSTKDEFLNVQRNVYILSPFPGMGDGPKPPTRSPFEPTPDPKPPEPPKSPDPKQPDPKPPVKTPDPKPPEPPVKAPDPKPPVKTPDPKPPEPPVKAPDPKPADPKPPVKTPDPVPPPKPPEPPKK